MHGGYKTLLKECSTENALQISRIALFSEEGAKQAVTNDKVSTITALK